MAVTASVTTCWIKRDLEEREEYETHFTLPCQSTGPSIGEKGGSSQEPVNILEVSTCKDITGDKGLNVVPILGRLQNLGVRTALMLTNENPQYGIPGVTITCLRGHLRQHDGGRAILIVRKQAEVITSIRYAEVQARTRHRQVNAGRVSNRNQMGNRTDQDQTGKVRMQARVKNHKVSQTGYSPQESGQALHTGVRTDTPHWSQDRN